MSIHRRHLPRTARALLAGIAMASLFAGACRGDDTKADRKCREYTALVEPSNALSEELMAALSQAKNFHAKADVLIDEGKMSDAAASIKEIFSIRFPADAPEGEEVVLDARARLAELYLQQGEIESALQACDEGIAQSKHASFFLANLHAVRGNVLHAKAKLSEDEAQASELRREAIRALDTSNSINGQLLEKLQSPSP